MLQNYNLLFAPKLVTNILINLPISLILFGPNLEGGLVDVPIDVVPDVGGLTLGKVVFWRLSGKSLLLNI